MGERRVTRERLRQAVEAVRKGHFCCEGQACDTADLLAAAEAVLRIERASEVEIMEATMPALWMSTRPPKYDVKAELDRFAIDCYRAGEQRAFAQLGALAPKDQP